MPIESKMPGPRRHPNLLKGMWISVQNYRRRDWVSAFLMLAALVGLLINGMKHGSDFQVFYLAGERLLKGISIYQESDGWMPYKYHPAWAAVFSAFSLLPPKLSIFIFNCLQIGIWFFAARIWADWLGYRLDRPFPILILLLLSFSAFSAETGYGQVNGMLLLGSTLLFQWLEQTPQKYFRAGFLMALIFALKLNFGILIIYCLIKNWRSVLGFIAGLFALHVIVAISQGEFFAEGIYRNWIGLLLTQSSAQYYIYESQGFLRFFHSLIGDAGKMLWIATMLAFMAWGLVLSLRKVEKVFVAAYWVAGTYLFSPLPWWYQILFMYPVVFLLLKTPMRRWEVRAVLACLFVYALITFNTLGKQGIIAFKQGQGFFVCSAFLFALLIVQIQRRVPLSRNSSLSSSLRIS